MTREEAKWNLIHALRWNDMPKKEALDMAIKALERESILDKIRAEVMNLTDGETPERIWNVDVLQIIDKYKTESEDE